MRKKKDTSKYEEKSEIKANEYVEKYISKVDISDNPIDMSAHDDFDIKRYLRMCVDAEVNVYYLTKWLKEIFIEQSDNKDESSLFDTGKKEKSKSTIKTIKEKSKKDEDSVITEAEKKAEEIQEVISTDDIMIPQKPKLLKMPSKSYYDEKKDMLDTPKKPVMPVTNIFNRSMLQREYNEQLSTYKKKKAIYDRRIAQIDQEYEEAISEYKKLLPEYESSMSDYSKAFESYQKRIVAYREKALKEAKKRFDAKLEKIMQETSSSVEKETATTDKEIAESKYKKYDLFLKKELEIAKAELKRAIEIRAELYSYSVVYPKYRDLIAMTTICEYFESGRCDSLEGANGAYNLYETELRANEIITQITMINKSLETIKAGQFLLYTELVNVNHNLETISFNLQDIMAEIEDLGITLSDMKSSLDHISGKADEISYYSAATVYTTAVSAAGSLLGAYYSKMNAQYAKKNAELTDSLGYLVAFK